MADIKITDLPAYTDPVSTDVLPIVDVGSDLTKKVSIADLLENAGTGSATAPSFSFDGDNDTGIYRPGANRIAITTNGTQRLLVNSSGSAQFTGSAEFAGNVYIGGTNPNIQLFAAGSSKFGGTLAIGTSTSNADRTILLNANGNAEFAGYIISGLDPTNGANAGCKVDKDGTFRVARPAGSQKVWDAYKVGDASSSSIIYANGSAEFAGGITSTNGTQRSYMGSVGYAEFTRIGDGTNGAVRLNSAAKAVTIADQNDTNKIYLDYDGSATFAGNVIVGPSANIRLFANGSSRFGGSIGVGPSADSNNQTITLNTDGSAGFDGLIQSGGGAYGGANDGCGITPYGLIYLSRTSSSSTSFLNYVTGNSTPTIEFTAGGSATFAGSVSIGGTAAANTIDEYEEGTWTPAFTEEGGNTFSGTYLGSYVRCGNSVVGTFNARYDASSNIADNTQLVRITGFPYNTNSTGGNQEISFLVDNRSNSNTGFGAYGTNTTGYRGVIYDGEIRLFNLDTGAPIKWSDVKTPTTGPTTGFKASFTVSNID